MQSLPMHHVVPRLLGTPGSIRTARARGSAQHNRESLLKELGVDRGGVPRPGRAGCGRRPVEARGRNRANEAPACRSGARCSTCRRTSSASSPRRTSAAPTAFSSTWKTASRWRRRSTRVRGSSMRRRAFVAVAPTWWCASTGRLSLAVRDIEAARRPRRRRPGDHQGRLGSARAPAGRAHCRGRAPARLAGRAHRADRPGRNRGRVAPLAVDRAGQPADRGPEHGRGRLRARLRHGGQRGDLAASQAATVFRPRQRPAFFRWA